MNRLRNKKILITAGPTCVAIDSVRVISNTASAETGLILADKLCRVGAKVTLLLGPVASCCINPEIRVMNFRFFDELKNLLERELKKGGYFALVHSAAVSDYRPEKVVRRKISSGLRNLKITLVPTQKLIDRAKKLSPFIVLVGFKFEPQALKDKLIGESGKLLKKSKADLVIANTFLGHRYKAFAVSKTGVSGAFSSRAAAVKGIIKFLKERI